MITSPEGDGVILMGTYCKSPTGNTEQEFYQLKPQSNGTFEWITLNKKLKYARIDPIMVYIDESKVNCYTSTTSEDLNLTTEYSTTPLTTMVSETTSKNPRTGKFEFVASCACYTIRIDFEHFSKI